ncbi:hypothetical protein DRH29_00070 [candidate division Kazan bacterium]|uniref:Uncharacterized protein n=1 Tax=candidate division Kazan bacterium TaxID=2202143 RepID=A0A420ZDN3_UNCK3|nr:MAG: hypothetical protein DRH29_00070 [candidate division Kazan bacterium]
MNKKIIQSLIKRIKRLENHVFGSKKSQRPQKRKSKSLPDIILGLRDSGFFKQPRTVKSVYDKLLLMYHTDLKKVDTALHRLRVRKKLRITHLSDGKKEVKAYVW